MKRIALLLLLLAAPAAAEPPRLGPAPLASTWWEVGDEERWLDDEDLDDEGLEHPVLVRFEIRRPDGSVAKAECTARSGERGFFLDVRSRRFHADNDVEIACSNSAEGPPSHIVDPIVSVAHDGMALAATPVRLPDGRFAVEAYVQMGAFAGQTPEVHLQSRRHGSIETPVYDGLAAKFSTLLGDAATLVVVTAAGETRITMRTELLRRPGTAEAAVAPAGGPPAVRCRLGRDDGDASWRVEIDCAPGRTASARFGRDRIHLRDWDVEVGCYNQVGDPITDVAFSGVEIEVAPRIGPGGGLVLLDARLAERDTELLPNRPSGMLVAGVLQPLRQSVRGFRGALPLVAGEAARLPAGRSGRYEFAAEPLDASR